VGLVLARFAGLCTALALEVASDGSVLTAPWAVLRTALEGVGFELR
jgi:hypothetical protein